MVYKDGREEYISNPAEFPDTTDPKMRVAHIEEPMGMYPYWLTIQLYCDKAI